MIVEMDRDSSRSIDDAHQLNRLIIKNFNCFGPAFLADWNAAYQAYCKDKRQIVLQCGQVA